MLKKIGKWVAIGLLAYFVIAQPGRAADTVENVGGQLGNAADSATTFTADLTDGR